MDLQDELSGAVVDRVCSPQETFARVERYLSGFGITRLARLTGLDCLNIPVWQAISPNARSLVINQGKGMSDVQAKVSAVMEALERAIAAEPHIDVEIASMEGLSAEGRPYVPLEGYRSRSARPFATHEPIEWVRGLELASRRQIMVPFQAVVLDRTQPHPLFWQSSDGLASGNCWEEAVLHGLLERVERDAETLWRLRSLQRRLETLIDPAGFECPDLARLCKQVQAAGLRLRAFDMTSDLGVPAYAVYLGAETLLRQSAPRPVDVVVGRGCHFDPAHALIRAITEAAQSRLTFISGARDDILPSAFHPGVSAELLAYFAKAPRAGRTTPKPSVSTVGQRLERLIDLLARRNVTPLVSVDLGEAGLPFNVVKIIAPRLESPPGERVVAFGARASMVLSELT